MSTGEALYLALVIVAMCAFGFTLAWVAHVTTPSPRKARPAKTPNHDHRHAAAH